MASRDKWPALIAELVLTDKIRTWDQDRDSWYPGSSNYIVAEEPFLAGKIWLVDTELEQIVGAPTVDVLSCGSRYSTKWYTVDTSPAWTGEDHRLPEASSRTYKDHTTTFVRMMDDEACRFYAWESGDKWWEKEKAS